ncbi:hypothetical protein KPL76_09295 [Subtercola sp. PAMC28395]|uniref:hypothetical protein n=1 Tax=Subtercola sp. PAMC28395 TaxID=2846775 RepID=UPI001C0DA3D0|nr:hypothetical protein [Subtercola sp. PAMC28395]QWT22974.1 hypothetical protein KPL76_09295 [Subtercola sp. PAMC28395]
MTDTTIADRSRLGRWMLVVLLIVANAAVQALLVDGDPIPGVSWWFVVLVLASFAAVTVTVWLGCALLEPLPGVRTDRRPARLRLLAWSTGAVVVAAIGGVIVPALALLPALLAAFVLPPVAAGEKAPVRQAASVFRRHPVRAVITVIGGVVLLVLSWLAALLLGFFITGWLAAAVTWVCFGFAGALLVSAVRALR